jgi:protein-disulfide isomerase
LEKSMAKSTRSTKRRASSAQNERAAIIGIVGVVAVLFVVLMIFLVSQANQASVTANLGNYKAIPQTTTADGSPVLGSPDAKITIMEFADFSCPHCVEYEPTIKSIIELYVKTGKARLVFQPETFVGGQYSAVAASAALCAIKQNAFWEMHDALFNLQRTRGLQAFTIETMRQTASSLGLDGDRIAGCIANGETETTLQKAAAFGTQLGVSGTPSMLYSTDGVTYKWWTDNNGQQIKGGPSFETIAATIEQAQQVGR